MTRPDFVEFLLDTIDSAWDETNGFDPQPVLIDRRDSHRRDGGPRSRAFDLTENNAVGIGTQPTTQNTAIGTGYDYEFVDPVSVRVEALHEEEHGHVADASDFGTLTSEVLRTIHTVRTYPTSDPKVVDLRVVEVNDQSSDQRDYFRTDYLVEFRGFEDL